MCAQLKAWWTLLGGWIGLEKMAFQVSWRLLLRLKIIKISFRKANIPKFFAPAAQKTPGSLRSPGLRPPAASPETVSNSCKQCLEGYCFQHWEVLGSLGDNPACCPEMGMGVRVRFNVRCLLIGLLIGSQKLNLLIHWQF